MFWCRLNCAELIFGKSNSTDCFKSCAAFRFANFGDFWFYEMWARRRQFNIVVKPVFNLASKWMRVFSLTSRGIFWRFSRSALHAERMTGARWAAYAAATAHPIWVSRGGVLRDDFVAAHCLFLNAHGLMRRCWIESRLAMLFCSSFCRQLWLSLCITNWFTYR